MTDPQTPATEAAWNSLRADLRVAIGDDEQAQAVVSWHRPKITAAIEAEARADATKRGLNEYGPLTFGPGCAAYDHPVGCVCPVPLDLSTAPDYAKGRADALRKAAERVRDMPPSVPGPLVNGCIDRAAALAILDPETTP